MRGIVAILMLLVFTTSVSAFVQIDRWHTPDVVDADYLDTALTLDRENLPQDARLKVAFTIPELDIRTTYGPSSRKLSRYSTIQRTLDVPWQVQPGEYALRMTITDNKGNKRIKHRIIEIE